MRTNWIKDKFAQMCYTYIAKDSTPQDCDIVEEPIDDRIYFAGEHCCFDFIGTVNGAYISGVKTAEVIIG